MTYFDEVEAWLDELLLGQGEPGETFQSWSERAKKEIKREILDSYKRGKAKASGKAPDEEKPQEKKRRFWPRHQGK